MSTVKRSVIQVDVQDGAFKEFAKEFAGYAKALGQSRQESKEATAEAKRAADAQAKAKAAEAEALRLKRDAAKTEKEQNAEKTRAAKEDEKINKARAAEAEKEWQRRRKNREDDIKSAKDFALWTGNAARNVLSLGINAAKWLAFSSVAAGFGLGGLGINAASVRRQSQGYGISTGELRAANVNLGKYIDPESALSNIANAKGTGAGWVFNRVGVQTDGKDAAAILAEYLPKAVAAFQSVGGRADVAKATGLTDVIGIEDLRRLSQLSRQELSETIAAYKRDREAMAVDDETSRGWQDFIASMHRAGNLIETSLIKGLESLTPNLNALAAGIAKAIDEFVSSGGLQAWLKTFGEGIQKVANYLGGKEFKEDLDSFMEGLKGMAAMMKFVAAPFIDKSHQDAVRFAPQQGPATSWWQDALGIKPATGSEWAPMAAGAGGAHAALVDALNKQEKLPGGMLDYVWWKESRRGANPGLSAAGAGGDFQFMPGTAAQYGIKDRWDFTQSAAGAAVFLRDLLQHYRGDAQKALAAYNWGQGNLDADIAKNGANWRAGLPSETADYIKGAGMVVKIENNTGGNAQASIAALPGG